MPARLPEVNDHVHFFEDTSATDVRPRPGTVTAVTDIDTIDIRIGHSGETHAAVVRKDRDPTALPSFPCWTPY